MRSPKEPFAPMLAMATALTALALLAPGAGAVTVTVGAPDLSTSSGSTGPCDESGSCAWYSLFNTASAGTPLTLSAPADGTMTGWRVRGTTSGDGRVRMHVVRPVGDGSYVGMATTPNAGFLDGTTTNAASIAVQAGDSFSLTAETYGGPPGGVADVYWAPYAGASRGGLTILTDGGTGTPGFFTSGQLALYNATVDLLAPDVTSISPTFGSRSGGTDVTITGQHLAVATSVTFDGVPAQIVSASNGSITVKSPAQTSGLKNVQVTTAGGTSPVVAGAVYTAVGLSRPKIQSLRMAPAKFIAANVGGPILSARVGGKVTYKLSDTATMTFRVKRVVRRGGKRKLVPVKGSFTHSGDTGTNRFTFSGRIGGKSLRPGKYRLYGRAKDLQGRKSRSVGASFTIVR